jgi:Zn-dependent M28 family amino/carboxypeptidase
MLLNIARTLGEYNVRFKDVQVILAAFSGEEQGASIA